MKYDLQTALLFDRAAFYQKCSGTEFDFFTFGKHVTVICTASRCKIRFEASGKFLETRAVFKNDKLVENYLELHLRGEYNPVFGKTDSAFRVILPKEGWTRAEEVKKA